MIFPTHIVATAGIVENESQEILLIKTERNGWVFPGGQVNNGENLLDGVKREVEEETGIEIEIINLFCISSNTSEYEGYNGVKTVPTKVMFDFYCRPTGGDLRNSEENSESAWIPINKVMETLTNDVYKLRFKKYLEDKNGLNYLSFKTSPDFKIEVEKKV